MKRGVWIALALGGAIGATTLAALTFWGVFLDSNDPAPEDRSRWLALVITMLLFAAACVGALFLKRGEIETLSRPEGEAERQNWLDEMQRGKRGDE